MTANDEYVLEPKNKDDAPEHDPMRFAIMGSGSKGNAMLIQGGGKTVLLDAGLSARALKERMQHIELELAQIDALIITHAHGDHSKSAKKVAGSLGIPTFATEKTHHHCARRGGLANWMPLSEEGRWCFGNLTLQTAPNMHDAPGTVTVVLDDGESRLGVCSDLGIWSDKTALALSDLDTLVLEFNHDQGMLARGPYPARLKRRVRSKWGHLSNEEAAHLLSKVISPRLKKLILSHLSEVNNTPHIAMEEAKKVRGTGNLEMSIAPQHHPTGWIKVRKNARGIDPSVGVSERGACTHPPSYRLTDPEKAIPSLRKTPISVAERRQLNLFSV